MVRRRSGGVDRLSSARIALHDSFFERVEPRCPSRGSLILWMLVSMENLATGRLVRGCHRRRSRGTACYGERAALLAGLRRKKATRRSLAASKFLSHQTILSEFPR